MPEQFESNAGEISIENEPTKEVPDYFDALIVLGKNWRKYPPKKESEEFQLQLSLESKMSSLAAGEMFKQGLVNKIIFSGGATAGAEYPTEAEAMIEYLKEKYPEIPEGSIMAENASIDTPGNAEQIAEILANDPALQKIALMTVGFHMPRAEKLFEEFGIETTPFPSEEELKKRSPQYERFVKEYLKSGQVKKEVIKEAILRSLLYVDRRGELLRRLITKKVRHQQG
ncbi:MAG TPA: YdcF family protein [Candidatus Paceibacterota bacterium]